MFLLAACVNDAQLMVSGRRSRTVEQVWTRCSFFSASETVCSHFKYLPVIQQEVQYSLLLKLLLLQLLEEAADETRAQMDRLTEESETLHSPDCQLVSLRKT